METWDTRLNLLSSVYAGLDRARDNAGRGSKHAVSFDLPCSRCWGRSCQCNGAYLEALHVVIMVCALGPTVGFVVFALTIACNLKVC